MRSTIIYINTRSFYIYVNIISLMFRIKKKEDSREMSNKEGVADLGRQRYTENNRE